MKIRVGLLVSSFALVLVSAIPARGVSLLPGWPQVGGGPSSPAVGDLDGDGIREVVSAAGQVSVWHPDGSLAAGWPQSIGALTVSSPALGDVDKDGVQEVVVGSPDGKVYGWHADGTPLAGWPQSTGGAIGSSPALGDVDGDGLLEVAVGSDDGKLYIWRADGTPLEGWPRSTWGAIRSTPALGDLDGDGKLEAVFGSDDYHVYAARTDGTSLVGWPKSTGGAVASSPALGDLDGDGKLEVVVGSGDGNVYAWHADGTPVAGWPQLTGVSGYTGLPSVTDAPALADLDADGDLEVIASGADAAVYVWHANGTLMSGWPQTTYGFAASSPAVGDLDGDGKPEVVVGVAHSGNAGYVWAWHADGTEVAGWPAQAGLYIQSSPALADVDGDGRVEVVIGCEDGKVYIWKADTTTNDPIPWSMFHHDARRTGLYVATATPTASFMAVPTFGPAPLTVYFSDTSSGHPTQWTWNFGDGGSSTLQDPKHQYANPGEYTVSLTASNAEGYNTVTKPGYIGVKLSLFPGWPQATAGEIAAAEVGDIDGDGDPEVVAGAWYGQVYAWHTDGTLVAGWPQSIGDDPVTGAPALGDLDGNGKLDIVVGAWDRKVHIWHADGTPRAGWPQDTGADVEGAPALGDVDGDGKLEIVAAAANGAVYVWRADGSALPGWPLSTGLWLYGTPALGDLDGDGNLEVVVGAYDGKVYVWRVDSTLLPGWPAATGGEIFRSSPALGDIDGDGQLEVVVGSEDHQVYAWNADGSRVSGWPQGTRSLVESSPALGDIDADGALEVIAGSSDNKVYAWHGNGSLVPGWPQSVGSDVRSSPALADLDGDGKPEVVFGASDGYVHAYVYAWHADGTAVSAWPQRIEGSAVSSPTLADLDHDGKLEVLAGGQNGVFIWKSNTATVDRRPWPNFHHDARRTGRYVRVAAPGAAFAATPVRGPAPLTVYFTDLSTGVPLTWAWDFGDGTTSSVQSPTHVYSTAGVYTVTLTVTNTLGPSTATRQDFITVELGPLTAQFSGSPTSGVAPLTVQFTDQSGGGPETWAWVFGDGATSAKQNPAHTYTAAGTYTVALTVTKGATSHTATKQNYITVTAPPAALAAEFSADPRTGPPPLAVTFTDLSTGGPETWAWTFGDGAASTEQSPVHTYTANGSYTVTLTVTKGAESDIETKPDYIVVTTTPPALEADFVGAPVSGVAPLAVHFTDQSLGDPAGWSWHFGDGASSTDRNPAHTYTASGSYTVSLTVSKGSVSDTETKPDYITVTALPPPAANFTATPTSGPAPLTVQFTDASTGAPTKWAWDFGDGGISTEQNPTHIYTAAGAYTVNLTVSNAGGASSAKKKDYIVVGPPPPAPVADFSAAPRSGTAPLTVTFADLSTNAPTSWVWHFGDGVTSTEENPVHVYRAIGLYTVSLTVRNAGGGDTEEKYAYIVVTFSDVPAGFWALNQILACVQAGIVSGYPGDGYQPSETVTRDQMAVFIARALAGGEVNVPAASGIATFPDVPAYHWAYKYVEYTWARHVVEGYPDGTYQPANPVDRGQMAIYIARAIANPTGDEGLAGYTPPAAPTFPDVGTDYYAYKYIEYIKSKGVAGGYPDGTYQPGVVVTRDQMAVYVVRAFELR